MPWQVERLPKIPGLRPALRDFIKLCERNAHRGTPDTFSYEAERFAETRLASVTAKDLEALVAWFAERLRTPQARNAAMRLFRQQVRRSRRRAERTPAGRELLDQLINLEHGVVGSALPLFADLADPMQLSRDILRLGSEFQRLGRVRSSEEAADLLLQVAIKSAQPAYERLLRLLWRIEEVRLGRRRGFPPLANAMEMLSQQYPTVVQGDFLHIRNAAGHGCVKFDPVESTVHLRDRGWSRTYDLDDLSKVVLDAFWASGPGLQDVFSAYNLRMLYEGGLVDATVEALCRYPVLNAIDFAAKEETLRQSIRGRWPLGLEWTPSTAA